MPIEPQTTLRLDKWLWFTRLVKTRTQASKLISTGKIRVNRIKITKPATTIRCDDIVTAMLNHRVKVVKVCALGDRRGPASAAQELYEDLTPPPIKANAANGNAAHIKAMPPSRDKGTGRPTKKQRRQMDAFESQSTEK